MKYFKNEEHIPFIDLTYEQRTTIINAKILGIASEASMYNDGSYVKSDSKSIELNSVYRVTSEPITKDEIMELIHKMPNMGGITIGRVAQEIFDRGLADEA